LKQGKQGLPGHPPSGTDEAVTEEQILAEFRAADALLEGHFILSSGLRSSRYLQCARVLMDPARAELLARALAAKLPEAVRREAKAVVAPAMGGLICGHELARALGLLSLFVERPTGTFELRRGFRLDPGTPVILMEDVVTTGLSSREAIAAVEAAGGKVIHAASLVDRSDGKADLGVPFTPLLRLSVPSYPADALPPELAAIPAVKPGSRAA
jgi:orotate phosphoribosyltransferase